MSIGDFDFACLEQDGLPMAGTAAAKAKAGTAADATPAKARGRPKTTAQSGHVKTVKFSAGRSPWFTATPPQGWTWEIGGGRLVSTCLWPMVWRMNIKYRRHMGIYRHVRSWLEKSCPSTHFGSSVSLFNHSHGSSMSFFNF